MSISRANPVFTDSLFSIATVADGGGANPISTALSVRIFPGLDEANIICSDSSEIATALQEATVLIGKLIYGTQ